MTISDHRTNVEKAEYIEFLNQNFSVLNEDEVSAAEGDIAAIIAQRVSKWKSTVHRHLGIRDVILLMLTIGLDMPVVDLMSKNVRSNLNSDFRTGGW